MSAQIILASASEIRAQLLRNAGVSCEIFPARIDEESIKLALEAEDAPPRDVADTLAELKARKIAEKGQKSLVLGCDQVLSFKGNVFSKPKSVTEARDQLKSLRGETPVSYTHLTLPTIYSV